MEKGKRYIGIRHRVKKSAEGEARPTQVAIRQKDSPLITYNLPNETAELDWVSKRFPTKFKKPEANEDLTKFIPRHIKWKKLTSDPSTCPANLIKKKGKTFYIADKVPAEFDGLSANDNISMILGGSGDYLAFAISRKSQDIGSKIFRITPFNLQKHRADSTKNDDAKLLAELLINHPGLFFEAKPRDRSLISLREKWDAREAVMKDRIACEQRIWQRLRGIIFCNEEGDYPEEDDFEKIFEQEKAKDKSYQTILAEEKEREKELVKAVEENIVYQKIFQPIVGCGPMISSRIIAKIIDIRRFPTDAKFAAYCGVHVLPDGRFPRRRNNETSNWENTIRTALYLLGDQFNRRPESEWGQKLLEYKRKLREKHPEPIKVNGKSRYSNGHIHKMALWRVLTKFTKKEIFKQWWELERELEKVAG